MQLLLLCVCLALAIALSAFFSGSETGFYRATRIRFVLDALGGSLVARGLHWLSNNPAMFVATTLIGNNLANYATSLAIVLVTRHLAGNHDLTELVATVAMAPIVFVYGELLPKNLFYQAPNTLLRRVGGLFLVFTVLFYPVAVLLAGLGRAMERVLGQTPLRLRLVLARQELQEAMQEGHEAGVLRPFQYGLAQNLFTVASKPVSRFMMTPPRDAVLLRGARREDALKLARRQRSHVLPVAETRDGPLVGYVRTIDLYLQDAETVDRVRPLPRVRDTESHVAALVRMRAERHDMMAVADARGNLVGLLLASRLTEPLLQGQ